MIVSKLMMSNEFLNNPHMIKKNWSSYSCDRVNMVPGRKKLLPCTYRINNISYLIKPHIDVLQ